MENENKKTVVIYASFYEAMQLLSSDGARVALFNGMMEYGLNGTEPTFETSELKLSWTFYKPTMDANKKRYDKAVENGRKSSGNKTSKKAESITGVLNPPSTKVEQTPVIEKITQPVAPKVNNKLINYVNSKGLNEFDKTGLIQRINDGSYETFADIDEAVSYII
jgi:hypothetical protein